MEAVQAAFGETSKRIQDLVNSFVKPLEFMITSSPVFYVNPSADKHQRTITDEQYLPVANDRYGFFIIAGKKLTILNPNSSRCGRLLSSLIQRRSTVVDYATLKKAVGSGDLDKNFKDLKRQLRLHGYCIEYDRPRTQGIVLKGLKLLQ